MTALLTIHGENYPAGCECGEHVGIATADVLDHAEWHRAHLADAIRDAGWVHNSEQLTREDRTGLAALYGYDLGFADGRAEKEDR